MATKPTPTNDTHSPVLVRMTNELKGQLQQQATAHGRTLTGEINTRLLQSFKKDPAPGIAPAHLSTPANGQHTNDKSPAHSLTEIDRAMLTVFHQLPPEKQLALLSLFR